MHSPAQAILWQIFGRLRWAFVSAAVFLIVAIALCQILPSHWTIQIGTDEVSAVGWFLGVSCSFMNIMLIAAFSMSGDSARDLAFARHMLVLPVRTSTLVAWPLASGCVTVAAVWLINASLVFRATGIAAPLWWPAAALALFLAIFLALAWTPIAQRWLHGMLALAVLLIPVLVFLSCMVLDVRWGELSLAALLIALIPIAYLAAHSGVGRARRGEFYDWQAWGRITERLARWRPAARYPFRSMSRAQLWYECRAHMFVPLFIACMLPCFLFLPALEPHDVQLGWRLLGMLLFAPIIVAMLAGGALGQLVDPLSKDKNSTFVLVRPISSVSIVRRKFVMAAMLTAMIWILFLGYISLLLLRPGFVQSIQHVASGAATWQVVAYPLLAVFLLALLSWKTMVETLWIGLAGRKWVEVANAFAIAGLILISFAVGLWIAFDPELQAAAVEAIPWAVGVLLALKLAVGAGVVYGLVRVGVISSGGAIQMAAIWLAVVFSLCTLALVLLPADFASPANVIASIAIFTPFARLAGAPLALHWNRHR